MQLQEFNPKDVVVNPALLARKGEPDKKKVDAMAENMVSRREAGRPHQIQPGVVRVDVESGVVECFVGQHRLAATRKLCSMIAEGDEPYPFYAIAVPSTDEQALIDAIEENAWREATTLDDKAYAVQMLNDLGKQQAEIAAHLKISVSMVSDLLRYSKLPAKHKKSLREGGMTEEAALFFARYNKDAATQEKLIELAVSNRQALDALKAKAEGKATAEADAEAEHAAEAGDAAEEPAGGKKKAKSSVPVSDAVKNKPKGGGKKATPGRVTATDAKEAAKKLGVKKKKTAPAADTNSKAAFLTFLAANYGPNVEDADIPAPIVQLATKIAAWFDKDITDQQLKNALIKCCKEDFE